MAGEITATQVDQDKTSRRVGRRGPGRSGTFAVASLALVAACGGSPNAKEQGNTNPEPQDSHYSVWYRCPEGAGSILRHKGKLALACELGDGDFIPPRIVSYQKTESTADLPSVELSVDVSHADEGVTVGNFEELAPLNSHTSPHHDRVVFVPTKNVLLTGGASLLPPAQKPA